MPVYLTPDDTLYAAPDRRSDADTEMSGPPPASWYAANRDTGDWVVDDALYEAERERRIARVDNDLRAIDDRYRSDRSWREHVIANPTEFATSAVGRMQAAEDEAAPLRAHRSDLLNAVSPDLPDYDNELAEL